MANTRIPGTIIRSGSIPTTALGGGVVSSSVQVVSSLPTGSVSSSAQIAELLPPNTVSSSTQVVSFLPTGTVSASSQYPGWVTSSAQVDYTQLQNIPAGIASSSAQVTAFLPAGSVSGSVQVDITNTTNYTSFSSSLATVDAVQTSRLNALEDVTGSYATTGSNTFVAPQTISDTTNSTSYLDGALHVAGGMSIRKDVRVSGSMTINGLLTAVSMSTQYVTSSEYVIGTSRITLNDDDNVRFAGISIIDSGSSSPASASIFWDSLKHKFIYENLSGSAYNSAIFIAGPKNTGSLGDEIGLTSGYVPIATGDDHIDNSVIFQSGSNIGIGTASPLSKLTVIGNIKAGYEAATGILIGLAPSGIPSNNVNAYVVWGDEASFGGNNGDLIYIPRTSTEATHRWYTGNGGTATEKMRLNNLGNLGIGTTNPNAKLHVNGENLIIDRSAGDPYLAFYTSGTATNVNVYGGTSTGFRVFIGGSERMRIDTSGNLGLGVTPSAWVDYKALQLGGGSLASYTGTAYIEVLQNAYYNGSTFKYVNDGFASRYGQTGGFHYWSVASSGTAGNNITFGTDAMRLDVTGNLGIGTISPNYKLHVEGNIYANGSVLARGLRSGGRGELFLNANATDQVAEIFFGYGNGYTEGNIRWGISDRGTTDGTLKIFKGPAYGGSFSEVMSLTAATTNLISITGNVGIGSTSPVFTMDSWSTGAVISGTATIGSNMRGVRIYNTNTATTNNAIGLWFSTGPHQAGIASFRANADSGWDTALAFYTHVTDTSNLNNATEKMRITGDGNIGVGTTNPQTKLDVTGRIQSRYSNTVSLSSTATTTLAALPLRCPVLVSVFIYWNSNINGARQFLLYAAATDTGWGSPNSAITILANQDWSSGYVGTPTFTIGGSGNSRTLEISVGNAPSTGTVAVTALASIIHLGEPQ